MNKKISIVVGVRNRNYQIKHLISSLIFQTYNKNFFELIIVNYGGDENLQEIIKKYSGISIKYIYVDEKKIFNESRAKNIGIKNANGKIVICTNADIIFSPKLLELFVKQFNKNSNSLFQLRRRNLKENLNIKKITAKIVTNKSLKNNIQSISNKFYQGDFQASLKENWFKIKGYDERLTGWGFMDQDLSNRMVRIGVKQIWLDYKKLSIYHQYHTDSIRSINNNNINRIISKRQKWQPNNWGMIFEKTKILFSVSKYNENSLKDLKKYLKKINNLSFKINLKEKKQNEISFINLSREKCINENYDYIIEITDSTKITDWSLLQFIRSINKNIYFLQTKKYPIVVCLAFKNIIKILIISDIRVFNQKIVVILIKKYNPLVEWLGLKFIEEASFLFNKNKNISMNHYNLDYSNINESINLLYKIVTYLLVIVTRKIINKYKKAY